MTTPNAASVAASMSDSVRDQLARKHAVYLTSASVLEILEEALSSAPQQTADEKDALLRQALEALEGFVDIASDSQGVAGYHLSGDTAEWDEFDEVDAASSAIEAIGNHLGVKND